MLIISAELSGKAKSKDTLTRTEGQIDQGQSIGNEIIFPRGRAILRDEKVCRYSDESLRFRIKNLIQQMTSVVADILFGASLSHGASSTSLGVVNFNNP
jgi:hypothetical protein